MSAHERALAEAEAFVREHPEFSDLLPPHQRLDTGETGTAERSDWLSESRHHKHSGYGGFGDLSRMENDRRDLVHPLRNPEQRTFQEKLLDVRVNKCLDLVPENQRALLEAYYWENKTQEDIGRELGISQQAVAQRLRTAEATYTRILAEHAAEMKHVDEEDL